MDNPVMKKPKHRDSLLLVDILKVHLHPQDAI